jgi:hypothetical protein
LKNVDILVLLLCVTTALLCLLVATCSLTEVLLLLATVNEVWHKEQKAECSFTPVQKFKLFQQGFTYNTFSFFRHLYSVKKVHPTALIFSKLLQKRKRTNATSVTGCL